MILLERTTTINSVATLGRIRDKDRGKDKEKDNEKGKGKDKGKDKNKNKDKDKGRNKSKSKNKSKDKETGDIYNQPNKTTLIETTVTIGNILIIITIKL